MKNLFYGISQKMKEDRGMLNKRKGSQKIVFICAFLIFTFFALTYLLPLLWMFISTFQDSFRFTINIALRKPFAMDGAWTFDNYVQVFASFPGKTSFIQMIWNSVWMTTTGAALGVFSTAVVAYCMSKYKFIGRNLLYALTIFAMTIPIMGTLGAQFSLINLLKLYDTPALQFITSIGGFGGIGFLIMYGYFKNISWSYAEAVFIDGGGDFTVFFKIMLPQAMPMLTVMFVTSFIGGWSALENIIMFFPSYPTLASGMYIASTSLLRTGKTPVYYAGLVITMLPLMILFAVFADKIMKNMSVGGLKG